MRAFREIMAMQQRIDIVQAELLSKDTLLDKYEEKLDEMISLMVKDNKEHTT